MKLGQVLAIDVEGMTHVPLHITSGPRKRALSTQAHTKNTSPLIAQALT